MAKSLKRFGRRFRKQSGQSLVEYTLVLAFIAIVVVLILQGIGTKVNNTISTTNNGFP